MSHFLDSLSHFAVSRCRQSRLVPVVDLASLVQELDEHRRVSPVNVFL